MTQSSYSFGFENFGGNSWKFKLPENEKWRERSYFNVNFTSAAASVWVVALKYGRRCRSAHTTCANCLENTVRWHHNSTASFLCWGLIWPAVRDHHCTPYITVAVCVCLRYEGGPVDVRVFHNWLDLPTQQCDCDIETRGGSLRGFVHSLVRRSFIQLLSFYCGLNISLPSLWGAVKTLRIILGPCFKILLESDNDYGNKSNLWSCDPEEK